ncbi:MAG: hypothetical protein PHD31_02495 [Candidatus Pacebacteria bacterium]|nr:hypothetical protein [Candidatus Paceibacterota bacterium]
MGEHTKIVLKKLQTVDGVYKLKEERDLIVGLFPGDESLSIKGVSPMGIVYQLCLFKTFEIHKFDEETVVLWQVAEGVIDQGKLWMFGYDKYSKNVVKSMYEDIGRKFLKKVLDGKKPMFIIVSTESGKLVYREVVIFN